MQHGTCRRDGTATCPLRVHLSLDWLPPVPVAATGLTDAELAALERRELVGGAVRRLARGRRSDRPPRRAPARCHDTSRPRSRSSRICLSRPLERLVRRAIRRGGSPSGVRSMPSDRRTSPSTAAPRAVNTTEAAVALPERSVAGERERCDEVRGPCARSTRRSLRLRAADRDRARPRLLP